MKKLFLCLVSLLAVASLAIAPGLMKAASPSNLADRGIVPPEIKNSAREEVSFKKAAPIASALLQQQGPVNILIEMQAAPGVQVYAEALKSGPGESAAIASQNQVAQIESAEQALLAPLAQMGAQVIYRTKSVYNGIAVMVDATQLKQIAGLPGVKAVHQLIPQALDNWHSVPFIGAPEVWENAGLTGDGVKIAIIDSGIDYIHADFGGPGTDEAYLAGGKTTIISDTYKGVPLYPTAKVVGGIDLVGDDYDADHSSTSTPHPDPDPAPCYTGGDFADHGTHVAGTAAGYGINADGTTYTGTYTTAMDFAAMKVGPGAAPEAELLSVRVFGCNGTTNMTIAAIEWAVDPNGDGNPEDHVDVINMSLGSTGGSDFDSTAQATDNAVLAGVVVVASAGNAGDGYYVVGSPSTADRAISVAASDDGALTVGTFQVEGPEDIRDFYPGVAADFGPSLKDTMSISGEIAYPMDSAQERGCDPFNAANAAAISGRVAMIQRGDCSFKTKVLNAQNAGALAVIVYNQFPGDPFTMADDATITNPISIPSIMTDLDTGLLISDTLATDPVDVYLSYELLKAFIHKLNPEMEDTMASFLSRGPRAGDSILKPDITAPGYSIFSALNHSGTEGVSYNGTSMAAPHMAGVMALLFQQHPDWSVEELKALAMNTATVDLYTDNTPSGVIYGPGRVGAGRVSVPNAAGSEVVAYGTNRPGLVSVSFGALEVLDAATFTQTVMVVNKGAAETTYNVVYHHVVNMPGVTYSVSPESVTVAGGGSAEVVVTLTADPATMAHTYDWSQAGIAQWLSEAAGYVVFIPTADGVELLRVPVHAAPRSASDMSVADGLTFSGETTALTLTGKGIVMNDIYVPTTISLVSPFELQITSPNENDAWSTGISNNADIQYVGVTSNADSGIPLDDAIAYFGIATYGNWATPSETEFDVYIDTNLDGQADYILFNWNLLDYLGIGSSDHFITVLYDLNTGATVWEDFINGSSSGDLDTAIFNSNVMFMPVYLADLGITDAANARFNYQVVAYSWTAEAGNVDVTPLATYDPVHPGVSFGIYTAGGPDLPGREITVSTDLDAYRANQSQGVLLLHHFNTTGNRAEVLRYAEMFIPIIYK